MADLIVLGGGATIEEAQTASGLEMKIPSVPGRADAWDDMTDTDAYDVLAGTKVRRPHSATFMARERIVLPKR